MLHRILKGIAPAFAFAAAIGVSGCDGHISINGHEGKPLAEIDTAGKTPTNLVLAGPDTVVVREGSALKIEVAGDPHATDALRFTLDDETLGILRKKGESDGNAKATVTVTLPKLEKLTIAGSGSIEAQSLSGKSEVVIAGSGTAHTAAVSAHKLEVTIAGAGTYRAAGTADELELTVLGSGKADMAGLRADKAEVTIAGSGDGAFASDGTVKATVMGSGEVTVTGSAKCTIKSMGSGTLHCQAGATTSGAPTPPAPPAAPEAPASPR
jgi:hypothetical protein